MVNLWLVSDDVFRGTKGVLVWNGKGPAIVILYATPIAAILGVSAQEGGPSTRLGRRLQVAGNQGVGGKRRSAGQMAGWRARDPRMDHRPPRVGRAVSATAGDAQPRRCGADLAECRARRVRAMPCPFPVRLSLSAALRRARRGSAARRRFGWQYLAGRNSSRSLDFGGKTQARLSAAWKKGNIRAGCRTLCEGRVSERVAHPMTGGCTIEQSELVGGARCDLLRAEGGHTTLCRSTATEALA